MAVRIPPFQQSRPVVDKNGLPTNEFLRSLNGAFKVLVDAQNATAAALAAAGIATAAAAAANAAAAASKAESSLVNSFVTNFVGASPLSADSLGNVTILAHDRQYGDTTLNPTRAVNSGMLATGEVSPAVVRVYYDDPTRAGGAVTYLFTVDPADPPVQGGNRHVVGAVEIPAAGTSDGGYVRPPGFTGVAP